MDLRFLLLLVCFFLSGFAALLYQTAWTREFAFLFGTSELAVVAVLAAYMGGLALGASVAARMVRRLTRPVLAYGLLELGIAVGALCVPFLIRMVQGVYISLAGGLDAPPETMALTTAILAALLPLFLDLIRPFAPFLGLRVRRQGSHRHRGGKGAECAAFHQSGKCHGAFLPLYQPLHHLRLVSLS
ncbi:MAG: hypothetical protein ABGY42_00745, partial [bacterium]